MQNIIVPDRVIELPPGIHGIASCGKIMGEVRAVLRNPDGSIAQDNGWQKNLILDTGLINMGTYDASWSNYCHVGSNNTAPATSQTALFSWLGRSDTSSITEDGGTPTGPNYEVTGYRKYRFNAGTATGTIREAGMGVNTSNSNLTTRILISPEMVKSAVQVLDIYYRITIYPDLTTTVTNNVNVSEDGTPVYYDVTSRSGRLGQYGCSAFGWFGHAQSTWTRVYDGAIGAITGQASGNNAGQWPNFFNPTYGSITPITDGCYLDCTWHGGLDVGNLAAGIRSVMVRYDQNFDHQFQFDAVATPGRLIPKDETKEIDLTFRITWHRI